MVAVHQEHILVEEVVAAAALVAVVEEALGVVQLHQNQIVEGVVVVGLVEEDQYIVVEPLMGREQPLLQQL